MPTRVWLSPPLRCIACTANTGRIRNRPSMRRAKIEARERLARISRGDMRLEETDDITWRERNGSVISYISRFVSPASAQAMDQIRIRGARTHNLKNLNLDLPRNRLIVITGLSGSGKSSLAFDTLYAEGQRRYVESLSAYARQFLQLMEKPDVDLIEGLSPAIAIEQKATSHNPRSTVGTVTEIHDYLRLLFARAGDPYCPQHDLVLQAQSVGQMVDHVLALPEGTKVMILSPLIVERKGEQLDLFDELRAQGFVRLRVNGKIYEMDTLPKLEKNKKHTIEIVVDRLKVR